jgi:hypothetical protein
MSAQQLVDLERVFGATRQRLDTGCVRLAAQATGERCPAKLQRARAGKRNGTVSLTIGTIDSGRVELFVVRCSRWL